MSSANPGPLPFKTAMSKTKLRAQFKDLLRILESSQPVASAEVKTVAASIIKAQEKPRSSQASISDPTTHSNMSLTDNAGSGLDLSASDL